MFHIYGADSCSIGEELRLLYRHEMLAKACSETNFRFEMWENIRNRERITHGRNDGSQGIGLELIIL